MIHKPVLLIGCPRSGTTLLYNLLAEVDELWSIGYESKAIIEHYHSPAVKEWDSGELRAEDITSQSRAYMLREFSNRAAPGRYWRTVNRMREQMRRVKAWRGYKRRSRTEGAAGANSLAVLRGGLKALMLTGQIIGKFYPRPASGIRLLEKTPENCLRLPFLQELFPDGKIIYLIRDGRANISSLMEGWREPHLFDGYPVPEKLDIPGYFRKRWAFTLIPKWRELKTKPLEEVSAHQWLRCNQAVIDYFFNQENALPGLQIRYEELISQPEKTMHKIAGFIEVDEKPCLRGIEAGLPRVNATSDPQAEKWRRINGEAIQRIMPIISELQQRFGYPTDV